MKRFLFLLFVGFQFFGYAQENKSSNFSSIDVNYFKGNIALHNNSILHLITGHPEGVIVSWNKKTFGLNTWEQRYNYPDYGVSFSYQNLKNEVLGNNFNIPFVDLNLIMASR